MPAKELEDRAVLAALSCQWEKAIQINKEILRSFPNNTNTLNRLARAWAEQGKVKTAQNLYKKVLAIDPYNQIAIKNIRLLKETKPSKKGGQPKAGGESLPIFLEEPGKTKIVKLVRLAGPPVLALIRPGQEVTLVPKTHTVSVYSHQNDYLGCLPDDLSRKLKEYTKAGNRYLAYVKSVGLGGCEIFIKEVFRGEKLKNLSSFPVSSELPPEEN